MSGYGFWGGVAGIWYALRHCDEYEHILCDNGHEVGWAENLKLCPQCGGELKVRVERSLMLGLSLRQMRTAIFPHRLYSWEPESPTCTLTWRWRNHELLRRRVSNDLYRGGAA